MDELIAQMTQRLGLQPAQAKQAIDMVLGFVKGRLPGPVASQLDSALTSGDTSSAPAGLGGIAKGIGGMLGG